VVGLDFLPPFYPIKPVVHEYYDEIVFTDPTIEFYQQFEKVRETRVPKHYLQVSNSNSSSSSNNNNSD